MPAASGKPEDDRGYVSPLGGVANSDLTAKGAGPAKPEEPGTPGYEDLHATFKALGIDRPESKEEMVTAVKNILAGKNRTYNEIMTADTPRSFGGMAGGGKLSTISRLAPPGRLYDILSYYRDLPENIYHGFQDVLGDRMKKTSEQVGKEAYGQLSRKTLLGGLNYESSQP
jgi:hypothetical protein